MLNIFRLSKMLLISGMVLAFSCVTFNADMAYALTCNEAKQELKKIQAQEIDIKAETKAYNDIVEEKRKASEQVNAAKANCNVDLANCYEYQSATVKFNSVSKKVDEAKRQLDETKKRKENTKKENVKKAQENVTAACTNGQGIQDADDKTDSANQYASDKKTKQDAVNQAQQAVDQKNKEREAYFNEHGEYDIFAEMEDGGQTDKNLSQKQQDLANHNSQSQKTKKQQKAADNSASAKKSANEALDKAINNQNEAYEEWNEAEINVSNALETQEKYQKEVTDAQRKMQQACASNNNSQQCKDAQTAYAQASNSLQEASASLNEAKDIYNEKLQLKNEAEQGVDRAARNKQNADQQDRDRAQQAVNDAQAKVDRFCTPGKSYNKRKCENATEELTSAKADDTYMGMEEEKKNAQQFKNDQEQKAKDTANAAIGNDASKAADAFISTDEIKGLLDEQERLKGLIEKGEEKEDQLTKARDAACAKRMKSKACDEAQKALEEQQRNNRYLENQKNTIDGQVKDAETTQGMVNEQINACKNDPSQPGCAELLETKAQEDTKIADRNSQRDQELLSNAIENKKAADENYKNALNAEALICGNNPESQECADAKAATQEAREKQKDAETNLNIAQTAADQSEEIKDTALVNQREAEYNKLKEQAEEICSAAEDPSSMAFGGPDEAACEAAQKAASDAKRNLLEAEKNKACNNENDEQATSDAAMAFGGPQVSDACQKAIDALAEHDQNIADETARKAEEEKAAKIKAICEKYGENSPECATAKELAENPDSTKVAVFGETGAVFTQATPPSGHVFSYTTEDGDVFEIVTRRIAFIILYIKPIVYIFAGFGLIAVAFGAIFNKMSWRHFSYVAIGLFMVANVGRLIEFVVTPYIEQNGQWVSDVDGQKQTEIQRDLSSAFGDTYHTFGYVMKEPVKYREIDLSEGFIEIGKEAQSRDSSGADSGILEGLAKKRGFCEGSSGSGWSNFKSCINDIVGTVKNVGNMVKGAVNTVYGVAGQARKAKDAIANISNSFKNMKGASASEIFNEFSNIMHYTDDFNDAVTGTIDTIGDGAINILNEAGDIGSAESYGGQSMSDILADGFFNISGTARSVEGLASDIQREKDAKEQGIGIYNKDGVFGKDGFGGFGKPSSNKNTSGTSSSTTSSSGTGGATLGTSGSGTANVTNASETTYEDAVKKTNNMYSDIQKQERELNNLKNQMAQAQKAADEACKEGSALCDVYKAQAASYDAMIKAGESKLSDTKSAYDAAKSENDQLYEQMLANNRTNAEKDLEAQKAEATKVCKGDPTSAECVNALKKVNDATTKLAKAIEEQEKRTKASYKETTEQKQGADNSTKYDIAVDNVNDLYKKEQAKEKELAIVSSEINKLQKQMDENNCSSNPNSDICKALGDQKSSLEGYKTEQENALKDIQKDKTKAQDAMDKEYKQYLEDNVKSAEAAQKSAQAEVDKACAGNNSNSESCLKARNKLIESINNVAKAKEEQKNPTDRTQTNEEKDQAKADQERKRQEANKKNSDEYNASVDNVNDLYKKEQAKQKEIDAVNGEISNLQDQYKENGCPDPKKAVCGALENQLDSLDKYKKEKESEKAQITKDKTNAEKNMEQEYKDYLQKNVDSAEAAQKSAQAEVDKSCTAGNEGSAACVKARKDLIDSMNNVAKAKEEQKKPTDRTQTNEEKDQAKADQERKRQEANKKNSDEYNASVDNVNDLYKKEQAKQKEIDAVNGEISNLQDQYKANGCPNPKKAVCGALKDQLDSLDKYKKEKESEKAQITKDKTNAEKNMEQEYKDYLQKNVDSAEAAQTKAQAEVDKSCTAGKEGSAACVKARKDLIDSMNNVAKAKEEQKKPTDRTQTNEEKDAKRKQTQEDKERQQALDEYDSKTNPEKVAQDLKNTYSELQEEVNRAKSTYNEKKQRTKDTKEAYETAKAKADQSGKPADIAEAKRLEKEYEKAQKEEKAAEKNLSDLDAKTKSTKTYYLQRAIDSETYKQAKYKAEMATISSDVSTLEADITAKRKEAEKLADRIMKLSSKSSLTDDEKIAIVTLRKEYEIAKAEYNQIKNEITQAKNRFEQLKNMYNKSVNDKKALEDELKSLT